MRQPHNLDTEFEIYLYDCYTMSQILTMAKERWGGGVTMDNLSIYSEHKATDENGYDVYEACDYTTFTVVQFSKSGNQ